jgi:transposase
LDSFLLSVCVMAEQDQHSALEDLSKERLAQIILDQQQTIRELRGEIQKLKEANEHLREQLETSEREGKRQAAPFRRKEQKRSENPSEPGRKEGHEGQTRAVPTEIDRRVEAELEACPHCEGTDIGQQRPIKQYIEELPPRQDETVELVTYRGECSQCGAVE